MQTGLRHENSLLTGKMQGLSQESEHFEGKWPRQAPEIASLFTTIPYATEQGILGANSVASRDFNSASRDFLFARWAISKSIDGGTSAPGRSIEIALRLGPISDRPNPRRFQTNVGAQKLTPETHGKMRTVTAFIQGTWKSKHIQAPIRCQPTLIWDRR